MLEISTSGLMSGDGKRSRALQSTATAPVLDSTHLGEHNAVQHGPALGPDLASPSVLRRGLGGIFSGMDICCRGF